MNLSVWIWSVPAKNFSGLKFFQRVTLHPVIRVRSKFQDFQLNRTSHWHKLRTQFSIVERFSSLPSNEIPSVSSQSPFRRINCNEPSPRPVPRPQCSYQPVGSPRRTHAAKRQYHTNLLSKRAIQHHYKEKTTKKSIIRHKKPINQSINHKEWKMKNESQL